MSDDIPFWERKKLDEMSREEWESLCDGCGQCCRLKLEEKSTGEVMTTDFACTLLDLDTCRCSDYAHRLERVPTCRRLEPESLSEVPWLPDTCAYVLLDRGEPLRSWHPLVSGDPQTVHEAGISVRGKVRSETEMEEMVEVLEDLYGVTFEDDDAPAPAKDAGERRA